MKKTDPTKAFKTADTAGPNDLVTCPRCNSFTKQLASTATSVNNGQDLTCPKCGFDALIRVQ